MLYGVEIDVCGGDCEFSFDESWNEDDELEYCNHASEVTVVTQSVKTKASSEDSSLERYKSCMRN